jgi:hypothetical protein
VNYQDLYATFSQAELRNVAARARLSVADVRQEALLWCWQVASGRSDYDARRGTVRRYVMAKLWGLAARESELPTVPWAEGYDEDCDMVHRVCAADTRYASPSVLEEIIGREECQEADRRREAAQCDPRRRYAGLSSTGVLMDQGISSLRIAALMGVTPQAVRQRVVRERARIGRNLNLGLRGAAK